MKWVQKSSNSISGLVKDKGLPSALSATLSRRRPLAASPDASSRRPESAKHLHEKCDAYHTCRSNWLNLLRIAGYFRPCMLIRASVACPAQPAGSAVVVAQAYGEVPIVVHRLPCCLRGCQQYDGCLFVLQAFLKSSYQTSFSIHCCSLPKLNSMFHF